MDKEKAITVVIGLLVGAGLASAYFLSAKFFPPNNRSKQEIITPPKKEDQVLSSISQIGFSLDSPVEGAATSEAIIKVSGKASQGSPVIVFANTDEKMASADGQGNFQADIKLEEGANAISVSTFSENSKIMTIKRNVILEVSL